MSITQELPCSFLRVLFITMLSSTRCALLGLIVLAAFILLLCLAAPIPLLVVGRLVQGLSVVVSRGRARPRMKCHSGALFVGARLAG